MENLDKLYSVMSEELEIYKSMASNAAEKRRYLIENNIPKISEFTAKEEQLISLAREKETEKNRILGEIFGNGGSVKNVTEILKIAPPQYKKLFEDCRVHINRVIAKIKDENNKNSMIINQCLQFIDFNLQFLSGDNYSNSIYSGKAKKHASRLSLLDRKF